MDRVYAIKIEYIGLSDCQKKYFIKIKSRAKSKKIAFNLTPTCIFNLLEQQGFKCALSKVDISLTSDGNTASLDRKHSGKPYNKSNIQWVHKDINRLKGVLTNEKFIEMCKVVTDANN